MNLISTKEAALRLGVTVPRVHALIKAGRLPAEKLGRDVFIKEADLRLVEQRRTGRPPKHASTGKRATGQKRGNSSPSMNKKRSGKK